jgi:hypothetical protein
VNVVILQGLSFYLLISVRCFNVVGGSLVVLGVLAASAAFWRVPFIRAIVATDVVTIRESLHELKQSPFSWTLLLVAVVMGAILIHGLVLPPIAFDSLMYQVLRPALWVQAGGLDSYHAPGMWLLLSARFPLGNSLTAWSMLPHHGDVLVPLVWTGVWVAFVLCGYAVARELGSPRGPAACAAAAAGTVPTVAVHMTTALVDNLVAALILAAVALLIAMERERDPKLGAQAVTALACAYAVKITGAPFFLLGTVLACVLLARCPKGSGRARSVLWASIVVLMLLAPFHAHLWYTRGNPFYPYSVKIGDWMLFEGGPFADGVSPHGRERPLPAKLLGMFVSGYDSLSTHINFGLAIPAASFLAPWAAYRLARARQQPISVVYWTLVFLAAFAFVIYSPTGTGLNEARYGAAAPAFFLALMAGVGGGVATALILLTLIAHIFYRLWFPWGDVDARAAGFLALCWVPFLSVAVLLWLAARRSTGHTRMILKIACASVTYAPVAVALPSIKEFFRHDIYEAAATGLPREDLPMKKNAFRVGKIFRILDTPAHPHRIAVTAGWDRRGINWFMYPLLGSRLQNQISYEPTSADGSFPDYRLWQPHQRSGDYAVWYQRIRDGRYDYVVTLGPITLELEWMHQHPEHFELVAVGDRTANRAYRVIHN